MEINAAAAWINATFFNLDVSAALAVHKLYELAGWFFTPFFELISFFDKGGICLIILSLILLFFKKTRRFGTAMCIGLAIGALITNCCLKIIIARPRPYVDQNGILYQLWLLVGQNIESDKSFPSGHTTAAFASMVPLFILGNKRWSWTALLFAFTMGIARIYLVVHFTSDVIGGVIVGTFAGIAAVLIANRIPQKWYEMNFSRGGKRLSDPPDAPDV